MEEALIEMERGRRLHGQDLVEPLRIEALVALFSGSFAPALAHLETVSRRSSQSIGDTYLALAYYYTGNAERARPMLEALTSHPSASTAARAAAALAGVLAAQGEREAARRMVDRVVSHQYRDHHVAYSLGAAYAQLGESHEALRWLGTAADTGSGSGWGGADEDAGTAESGRGDTEPGRRGEAAGRSPSVGRNRWH